MKFKVLGILLVVALAGIGGCGQRGTEKPEKPPVESENLKQPVKNDDKQEENSQAEQQKPPETEKTIMLYYVDENTGEITSKEALVKGDLSQGIINELKSTKILSDVCAVESISVNESDKKIDLAINQEFGDYIRSMGTTGSEQILECLVRTYLNAYGCEGLKITENGGPLDTGHAELEGYMSY